MVSILLITSLSMLAIICLPIIIDRGQEDDQRNQHKGNLITMTAFFQGKNATKNFIKSENKTLIQLLKVINLETYEVFDVLERRKMNLLFMQCLMDVHLGYPQALLWLKKHLNLQACDVIIGDWHYSPNARLENMKNSLSTQYNRILEYFGSFKSINFIIQSILIIYEPMKRLVLVILAYLDLIFDFILLMTIMIVLGPTFVWNNPSDFRSQIGILLLMSILVPLLKSAVTLANKRPLVVLDSKNWIKWKTRSHEVIWPLKIFNVICLLLVPAMLVFSSEKAKVKRKSLINKSYLREEESFHASTLEEFELLTEYIEDTRLAMLTMKRNELTIEIVIQLAIHITMILLSQTDFPIETGLQAVFQSRNEDGSNLTLVLLLLSVLWSFTSSALTSVNIKTESKTCLPWIPKVVLGIRYLFIFFVRITSIDTYFAPFIGLMGITNHYQAETISLEFTNFKYINDTEEKHYHYWNEFESEFQSVEISKLFRSHYTNPMNPMQPSITKYTGIPLQMASYIFLAMYGFYTFILSIIKYWINEDFQSASFGSILQHIIESLNFPEAYCDWDSDNDLDLDGHYKKWKAVLFEMFLMVLLQLMTNIGLLVPIWITGI